LSAGLGEVDEILGTKGAKTGKRVRKERRKGGGAFHLVKPSIAHRLSTSDTLSETRMGILTPDPRIQGTQGLTIHRVNKGIIKVCCCCCSSHLMKSLPLQLQPAVEAEERWLIASAALVLQTPHGITSTEVPFIFKDELNMDQWTEILRQFDNHYQVEPQTEHVFHLPLSDLVCWVLALHCGQSEDTNQQNQSINQSRKRRNRTFESLEGRLCVTRASATRRSNKHRVASARTRT
jgi:hypothetical protein